MKHKDEIGQVLCKHLRDASSSFSIGSFGAIAEFHRRSDESLELDESKDLKIATSRGAIQIDLVDDVEPLAYEALSRRSGCWQQGVVFCLPKKTAKSNGRSTLTELGVDVMAVREEDRDAILFDMGLAATNVDFCIRTRDPELLKHLRQSAGRSIFEPGNGIMGAIIEAGPNRIAISTLGRVEVYQGIGKTKTPEGPHTHVLPKFLKSGRTHSANIPVPSGYLPCLSLYPANPLLDSMGRNKPFDSKSHTAFQELLSIWGRDSYTTEKQRVRQALEAGAAAESYEPVATRLARTALRVTLRQARQSRGQDELLAEWTSLFDRSQSQSAQPMERGA